VIDRLAEWNQQMNRATAAVEARRVQQFGLRCTEEEAADEQVAALLNQISGSDIWAWQASRDALMNAIAADNRLVRVGFSARRLHLGHVGLARDAAERLDRGDDLLVFVAGRNASLDAPPAIGQFYSALAMFRRGQVGDIHLVRAGVDIELRQFEDQILAPVRLGRMLQIYGWNSDSPLHVLRDAAAMMGFLLFRPKVIEGSLGSMAFVDVLQAPHIALMQSVSRRSNMPTPVVLHRRLLPDLRHLGRRMSAGNPSATIFADDEEHLVRRKFLGAVTGGRVSIREQNERGGDPTRCPAFEVVELLCSPPRAATTLRRCLSGDLLCKDCKLAHVDEVVHALARVRAAASPETVDGALHTSSGGACPT
jgi:histidinol-phosphate aminotransferase